MAEEGTARPPPSGGPVAFPHDLWRPARWGARISHRAHAWPTVLAFFAVLVAVDIVGNVVLSGWPSVPVKLAMTLAVVMAARGFGLTWVEMGLTPQRVGSGVRVGLVAFGLVAVVLIIAVLIPASHSYFEDADVATDSVAMRVLRPLVVIPLGTALFEEILFRAVLLGLLFRFTTVRGAVLWSAVAFGVWHVIPAVDTWRDDGTTTFLGEVAGVVAVTGVAGVVLAWLRLRADSVIAPLLAHVATNSLAYVGAVLVLEVL